jgi:phasin family protein
MATKKTPSKTTAKTAAGGSTAKKRSSTAGGTAKQTATAATVPAGAELIEPVEASVAASKETMEAVMKAGSQAASKSYEQAVAMAQEQVEKASSSMFKGYDDVASYGKDNVDAYVQSTAVFAKGMEAMGKELMTFAQSALEANVANTKAMFGAKTVGELFELQTDFSRNHFDSLVSESAKLTELSMNLANDAMQPIQLRVNATVEQLMKPLAA